jgi:hypothetical protein
MFSKLESQLKEIESNDAKLLKQRNDLLELKEVLSNAASFFSEVRDLGFLCVHSNIHALPPSL